MNRSEIWHTNGKFPKSENFLSCVPRINRKTKIPCILVCLLESVQKFVRINHFDWNGNVPMVFDAHFSQVIWFSISAWKLLSYFWQVGSKSMVPKKYSLDRFFLYQSFHLIYVTKYQREFNYFKTFAEYSAEISEWERSNRLSHKKCSHTFRNVLILWARKTCNIFEFFLTHIFQGNT